jgi:hypothetical protein
MIRILSVIFFMLAESAIGATAATCAGPNPMITRVVVQNVTPGPAAQYHIVGTVTNWGSGQPSNTLQFVDIYQYGVKLDDKGIAPLAHGQSATFSYTWVRNPEAAKASTTLDFRMNTVQGSACAPNTYHLTF